MPDLDPLSRLARFYAAENAYVGAPPAQRNLGGMLAELDPDVVVDVPRSLPHGGRWSGHEGFAALFAEVPRRWSAFEVVHDPAATHRVGGDRVLVEAHFRGVLRDGGAEVEMPFVSLVTFTERGASRLDHFWKDTAAVVLAGRGGVA